MDITLGRFREEISIMNALYLTRDEPLEPLSISLPVDRIGIILGASPCITLHYGTASVTLSHIQTVKRSIKGGQKSYKIICGDYTASNDPVLVEYRLSCGNG